PDKVGKGNEAFVVGPAGRLLADSNSERRPGTDLANLPQAAAVVNSGSKPSEFGNDPAGRSGLSAAAPIPRMQRYVFSEQRLSTALQPVYSLLFRTAWLLALGVLLAVLFGMLMARHMVVPIRALQFGAQQLETSDFGHRIDVRTGDEIEDLANHFNRMA